MHNNLISFTTTLINNDTEYQVSLNADFKAQLNLATGGTYSDGNGYTWNTGDALPNPAPEEMYNGKKVTNMKRMFNGCKTSGLLDLSNFNTNNVTDMGYMFAGCQLLSSLDLRSFNTAMVTDMQQMFANCEALQSLDLSSFNTAKVTDMSYMLEGCQALKSIDLSSFQLAKDVKIAHMFSSCGKDTDGVPAVGYAKDLATANIFNDSQATGIDLSKLKFTTKVLLDATNFPDAKFRAFVSAQTNVAEGDLLTDAIIAKQKEWSCENQSIASLKGIEYFTSLTYLDCHSNQLTSLDITKNVALNYLYCRSNQLTSLDVTKNVALNHIDIIAI